MSADIALCAISSRRRSTCERRDGSITAGDGRRNDHAGVQAGHLKLPVQPVGQQSLYGSVCRSSSSSSSTEQCGCTSDIQYTQR